jgi:hypothetical protein
LTAGSHDSLDSPRKLLSAVFKRVLAMSFLFDQHLLQNQLRFSIVGRQLL